MNIDDKSLVIGGTKIKTWSRGYVPIGKELYVNDYIENHKGAKASVIKIPKVLNKSYMVEIKANGKKIICTPETLVLTKPKDVNKVHPINKVLVDDNAWATAESLNIGDIVVMEGGEYNVDSVQILMYTCSQLVYGVITTMSKSFIANDFYVKNY